MPNIFQRIFQRKQAPSNLPFSLMFTGTGFSMIPARTLSYIQDGYNNNSTLFAIVTALMQKFSSVPYYVYQVKNTKALRKYVAMSQRGYSEHSLILKASSMEELPDNHEVVQLLHRPNSYQTESEFRQMALLFLKITGLSTVYANKGMTGQKPLSLHVLPSQWVSLKADASLMDAAEVYFSPLGAGQNKLPRDQVYLWKYINPDFQTDGSHLYGISPIRAGLLDLKGSNEASKQMAKMYENGGARGILTPKENIGVEQVNQLRSAIENWLTGSDNKGKIGGMGLPIDYHDIGLDAVDMALINGKQVTDEKLATLFNYPPALLKADNKYDNANSAIKYVVTNSLYSDFVAYRDMWNNWLLPMFGSGQYYVDFDLSVLPEMQQDIEKVAKQAIDLVNAGLISRNEGRQMLKYDAAMDPAMDMFFVNSGVIPIGDASMSLTQIPTTGDYANPPA